MGKLIFYLVVLFLVAVTVPKTRAMIQEKTAPVVNGLKGKLVPGRLQAMADQLEARLGRGEGYPNNWPGWLRRDFSSAPEDPWGNLYFLDIGRRDFTVGSMGPDGVQGTPDDIKLKRRPRPN